MSLSNNIVEDSSLISTNAKNSKKLSGLENRVRKLKSIFDFDQQSCILRLLVTVLTSIADYMCMNGSMTYYIVSASKCLFNLS